MEQQFNCGEDSFLLIEKKTKLIEKSTKENKPEMDVYVVHSIDKPPCPNCKSTNIRKNGLLPLRTVYDIMIKKDERDQSCVIDKTIEIRIEGHQYQCNECGRTFNKTYSFVEKGKKYSKEFINYIQEKARTSSFSKIEYMLHVPCATVKMFFMEAVKTKDEQRDWKAPRVLGLCQPKLEKHQTPIISNILDDNMLEMILKNDVSTITQFLEKMQQKEKVKVAIMSIRENQRIAVEKVLPNAKIVVNKYEAFKTIDDIFNTFYNGLKNTASPEELSTLSHIRKILFKSKPSYEGRISRNVFFGKYAEAKTACELVTEFKTLYSLNKDEAEEALASWINKSLSWKSKIEHYIENIAFAKVDSTLNLISQWKDYILNHWDCNKKWVEEAESYEKRIAELVTKIVKNGMNYSAEILRGKIFYGTDATQDSETSMPSIHFSTGTDFKLPSTKLIRGFGVNVTKLLKYLEAHPDFLD